MKLSIIIVSWNCRSQIQNCLESLAKCGIDDFETIVVDAHSQDGTATYLQDIAGSDLADRLNLRLMLRDRKSNYSENNHLGISMARGDFLAISNPDIIFNSGFARTLALAYDNPDCIVGPQLVRPDGKFNYPCNLYTPLTLFCAGTVLGGTIDRMISPLSFIHRMSGRVRRSFQINTDNVHDVIRVPHVAASLFILSRRLLDEKFGGRLWSDTFTWFCTDTDMFKRAESLGVKTLHDGRVRLIHETDYSGKIAGSKVKGFEIAYGQMEYVRRWGLHPRLVFSLFFLDALFAPFWLLIHRLSFRKSITLSAFRLKGALVPSRAFEMNG